MSPVHRLPDAETARLEASAWIARLNADDAGADDRARFEAWRSAHPRNARAYEELAATWHRFAKAGRSVRAVAFGTAMARAPARRRGRHRAIVAVAAMLAVLAIGLGGWWMLPASSSFSTGIGEHASIGLPDGSRLELNSDSAVRVEYGDAARVVRLQRGEAFFTVAHAPERPFWVVADRTWVRAVGTAFNVHRRADTVRVTVSEGRVKVGSLPHRETPSDRVLDQASVSLLGAGQQVEQQGAHGHVRTLPMSQIDHEVSWRTGAIYFEDRPLGEVIDEMARYTPLRIEVGAQARAIPIGGTFQTNPQGAEALLAMLEQGLGLEVRRDGRQHVYVE